MTSHPTSVCVCVCMCVCALYTHPHSVCVCLLWWDIAHGPFRGMKPHCYSSSSMNPVKSMGASCLLPSLLTLSLSPSTESFLGLTLFFPRLLSRDLMSACWALNPDKRPSFSEIMRILDNQLSAAHVRDTTIAVESTVHIHFAIARNHANVY